MALIDYEERNLVVVRLKAMLEEVNKALGRLPLAKFLYGAAPKDSMTHLLFLNHYVLKRSIPWIAEYHLARGAYTTDNSQMTME